MTELYFQLVFRANSKSQALILIYSCHLKTDLYMAGICDIFAQNQLPYHAQYIRYESEMCLQCKNKMARVSYELMLTKTVLKSDNLQYNMLDRLVAGTNNSSTKHLMFQILFFFIISCKILCKNRFNLVFQFFLNLQK